MADDLAAALGVLIFVGILIAYNFIDQVITDLTASFGEPSGLPGEIAALVFVGAMIAAIVVYMKAER